jgi:hypothetical protein
MTKKARLRILRQAERTPGQNWRVRMLTLSESLLINGDGGLSLSGGLLLTDAPYFLGKGFLSFVGPFRSACPLRPAFQCPYMSKFFYPFYFSLTSSGQEIFIWSVRESNFESKTKISLIKSQLHDS